jgi:hypothetical protein
MPPIAHLHHNEPLSVGQITLLNTLNNSLAITRLPPPRRQGPNPNCTNKSTTILGRRLVGGVNEQQAIKTFANARLEEELPESGDEDLEDGEDDRVPVHKRHTYSREHKLIAIDYFNTIWKELEDGTFERLSCRYAARKLKITRKRKNISLRCGTKHAQKSREELFPIVQN